MYNGNGESILIVDDEPLIRQIVTRILTEANYNVISADSGKKATELYNENKDKIALVILDLTMPDLNGRDTFLELQKVNPNIKAIICSGFINNELVESMGALGIYHFVKKPFTIDSYKKIVYNVLNP